MTVETKPFQAEITKLLDLMVHSLYSHKEIFLRELVSNASDACDRLRYVAIIAPELLQDDSELAITIAVDKKARTITVSDNGIGMNYDDLVENLGTIARSGTTAFIDQLTGDKTKDVALIGQFGVGFYSSFMVADKVTVTSSKAGEDTAWRWQSGGSGDYSIEEIPRQEGDGRGTRVVLHLRKEEKEFLEAARIAQIIKTYSDHIALPIRFIGGDKESDGPKTINQASALWTRPKSEISDDQYKEFYHHVAHAFDDPWAVLHNRVEGRIEYTNLLFVPTVAPFDLFQPDRKHHVKLYVKRVFITDDCEGLLPGWLRFVRGIVDSEDLPLNVSREMLQHNPVLARISTALIKRIIGALEKKVAKAPEDYAAFWKVFGAVLKEGLYESEDYRARLLKLLRCPSTAGTALVGLEEYVGRMRPGQEAIFYITGEEVEGLRDSPQIEALTARGVEVLLLADPVDEFWVGVAGAFDDKPFQSVTRGDIALDKIEPVDAPDDDKDKTESADTEEAPNVDRLIAAFKVSLGDTVKDVRVSNRLTSSAVCLVADESGLDMHLERLLKQHNRIDAESRKVLEINPRNDLIRKLATRAEEAGGDTLLTEAAQLLLDQARIIEGVPVPDPAAFSRRMTEMMARGLGEA